MKKLFITILAMLLPMLAIGQNTGPDLCYNYITKGKVAEVIQNPNGKYVGAIEIPDKVTYEGEDYIVTKIASSAFINCNELISVTIPSSLTAIGSLAFSGCSSLTSVKISDLKAWCNITFDDNPLSYAHHLLLNGEEINDLVIPSSITSIGGNAFSNCSDLTSITIPNSLKSIGNNAFQGCNGLTSVHISNMATWFNIQFNSITSNPLYYAHYLFVDGNELKNIVIPDGISSIGNYAFSGFSGLTNLTIPNSVTSIGGGAFQDCSGLTSLTIPNNVSTIGYNAFSGCSSLTSLTIPNSVTSIGGGAFRNCSGLTILTIGSSVAGIGEEAFNGCSGLTSVIIPNSVISIGGGAFRYCSGLTTLTIGKSVKYIKAVAFGQCPQLKDVYCLIEKFEDELGTSDFSRAFYKSDDVVEYGEESAGISFYAFDGSYIEFATLHVPASAINAYMTTTPWSGFGEIVPISGEEMPKCATPTISYEGGKIKFSCETEGVEYVSEISSADAGNKNTDEVDITGKITVKVYATKSGYDKSDTAIAEIEVPGELKGDLNNDGTVNVADHVELTKIIMNED